jgi:hypothetical protein
MAVMANYRDLPREQIDQLAAALADILDSLGFAAMAKDCRGDRKQGGLSDYARVAIKNLRRDKPEFVAPLVSKLRAVGLA